MDLLTQEEQMVIETIRQKKFQSLTVEVNDGKIVLIRREETIKPGNKNRRQANRHAE